jgi:hypothetical protein
MDGELAAGEGIEAVNSRSDETVEAEETTFSLCTSSLAKLARSVALTPFRVAEMLARPLAGADEAGDGKTAEQSSEGAMSVMGGGDLALNDVGAGI